MYKQKQQQCRINLFLNKNQKKKLNNPTKKLKVFFIVYFLVKLSNLHFEFLRFDKVEQATHLCTDGFLKMNRLWSKLGATYDDVYSVNRGRVIASCKAGWTCV